MNFLYSINYGLIFSCIICYLFGSIPNGYWLVKYYYRKDIRNEGSGNVGTMNAFTVSQSKKMGIAVLILDFLKGLIPVLMMLYLFNFGYYFILISSIFIVVGHNYPVWLGFKGGRGLAAAAGIFIVLNFGFLVTWCLVWGLFFKFKKDILVSNVVATLSLPLFVVLIKNFYLALLNHNIHHEYYNLFILFTGIISVLIIVKHKVVLSRFIPFTAKNL